MNQTLIERLRAQAGSLRRKPTPLADLIPLLQEAAFQLELKDIEILELKAQLTLELDK